MKNKNVLIHFAILAVLGCLIYSNALTGEFVADDYPMIVNNPAVTSAVHLGQVWDGFATRIVGGLTFVLNYRIGQLNVTGYHIVNILIHILNAVLVLVLVQTVFQTPALRGHVQTQSSPRAALFAALIFLAHPLQTQAVAYISQRVVSLAALFYLATLIFYLLARTRNKTFYYAAAGTGIVCFFCKEVAFTLPAVLVVCEIFLFDALREKQYKRMGIIVLAGVLLISVCFTLVSNRLEGEMLPPQNAGTVAAISWDYVFTELNVIRTNLRHLFVPYPLSHYYDYPIARGLGEAPTLLSVLLIGALFYLARWYYFTNRLLSFCIVWFFVTQSAEIGFVSLYGARGAGVMYDHWMYLPLIGFAIFVPARLLAGANGPVVRTVLVTIVVVFSLMSYQRNRVWQTEVSLWQDTLKKAPRIAGHYLALGRAYQRKGELKLAQRYYLEGINRHQEGDLSKTPTTGVYLSQIYNNLGVIYVFEKKLGDAKMAFEQSLRFNTSNEEAMANLRQLRL